jgi:hypothetical protein
VITWEKNLYTKTKKRVIVMFDEFVY